MLAYQWINRDAWFREAMAKAAEQSTDVLEEEARRRAYEGWDEPVFYKGVIAGEVRRFSDVLLMFTLKARAPEKYRERVDTRHSLGDGSQPDNALSEAEALRIREAYLTALPAPPEYAPQGAQEGATGPIGAKEGSEHTESP